MDDVFDLSHDPVPTNGERRGRPEHIATPENRNKVSILVALGWSNKRIAAAQFITLPTLRKHYFSELKYRAVARDRLDAGLAMKLWDQVQLGNVSAIKEFQKLLERNDSVLVGQSKSADQPVAKEPKLGKKEAALAAAQTPDIGTTLGELMVQRQSGNRPN